MAHGSIVAVGALEARDDEALIGITDLASMQGTNGTVLFTTGRGGGWVTSFEVGQTAGAARALNAFEIPDRFLQLETSDMVFRSGSGDGEVLLAGLKGDDMLAVQVSGTGTSFNGTRSYAASGTDLGAMSHIVALDEGGGIPLAGCARAVWYRRNFLPQGRPV